MSLIEKNFSYLPRKDKFKCIECGKTYKVLGKHLEIHYMKHLSKGGENMTKREARRYKYEETSLALQLAEEGQSHAEIGRRIGRTAGAVGMLLSVYDRYRAGQKTAALSDTWKAHFQRYLSSNGKTAQAIRAEVHTDAEVKETSEKTEQLLQTVETNWKKTLQSIADLVEHEASRRTAQETAKLQDELTELREFKQQAQDSNIAGTLRKSLMSFK